MNRLTYCILPLLLLLAVEAGAGVVTGPIKTGPGVHPNNVGKCWEFDTDRPEARQVPCPDPDVSTPIQQTNCEYDKLKHWWICEDRPTESPCLAQMEAAMRSMDKFVEAINRGWVIGLNQPKATAGDLTDAYDQWTAAKACWRTP